MQDVSMKSTTSAIYLFLAAAAAAAPVDFAREVRPIFEKHCTECHGEKKQKSGFRLDVKAAALKGGDNYGPDVVPGKAKDSPLIQLVSTTNEDEVMPPKGARLSAAEIDTLTRWIDEGAVWPDGVDRMKLADKRDHWSFKVVSASAEKPQPLSIDAFIDAKLAENGLHRSPPANPVALIRRIAFDLTGLPPTPEQVSAFVEECREGSSFVIRHSAFQRLVDEFLASPRYGERWAQHWLDVVRFAETHGFEVNTERPNAWPYRDYVIRAFNNDTPYDRFIKEQIVGDAMGEDAATGFLVTASALLPDQIGKDAPSMRLARQDSLDEIVNNVGQTFLGLSIGCARCHDHKFDPITAKDYYAMQAFFAGVQYGERPIHDRHSEELRKTELAQLELKKPTDGTGRVIFIDDVDSARTTSLKKKNGHGENPAGKGRGYRDDEGGADWVSNISGGRYTWWDNVPDADTFTWNPGVEGRFRVWLSWGVHGSGVHTRDARYVLDRDGDLATREDQTEIGNADQFRFSNVTEGDSEKTPLWSGLRDAGVQELRRESRIILRGGKTGTGITADVLVLEEGDGLKGAVAEFSRFEKRKAELARGPVVFGGTFTEPEEIRLLNRGDPEQPKDEVLPAVLSAFGDLTLPRTTPEQERRKALADWIASPKNPLTARVMVNRIWQGHFGVGLVETPSDFGHNGVKPSHPELLDWLAAEFIRSGWSVKHMHRLIVMSETYRQSGVIAEIGDRKAESSAAAISPQSAIRSPLSKDAEVRLLWRFPGRRLEAEPLRDSMLAVSGQLNLTMYGRGFNLFNQRGGLSGFNPVETLTPGNQRRMIYAHKVRREPETVFGAFDCPDAGQSTAIRRASTTPIQALNLFNSRFTLQVSEEFAARVKRETGDDLTKQINRVYQLALTREASATELSDAEPVVREHGLVVLCRAIFNSNEFLFVP
jgi:mono/diheme cytochrome c family protein